jgi:hypothetical protein
MRELDEILTISTNCMQLCGKVQPYNVARGF